MTDIVCISPIDGREVARRQSASPSEIEQVLKDARAAQKIWRDVPLAERMSKLTAFVDSLLTMSAEAVPELALQMGRPVKWGGEFRGVEERARHMIKIAPESLAPHMPHPKEGFTRFIEKTPLALFS